MPVMTPGLRERAAQALAAQVGEQAAYEAARAERVLQRLRKELARQSAEYLDVHTFDEAAVRYAQVDIVQQEHTTIVLGRHEDLWLGVSHSDYQAEYEHGGLTAWDRCEKCGEWYALGRYAHSLTALGEMLADPVKHSCELEEETVVATPPLPSFRERAEDALHQLEIGSGYAPTVGPAAIALAILDAANQVARAVYDGRV